MHAERLHVVVLLSLDMVMYVHEHAENLLKSYQGPTFREFGDNIQCVCVRV